MTLPNKITFYNTILCMKEKAGEVCTFIQNYDHRLEALQMVYEVAFASDLGV